MSLEIGTPETFDAQLNQPGLVVLYFWGHDCPNCEVFARDFPELQTLIPPEVKIVKTNAYDHPELARRFGLFGIPAFILFKDGKKLGMMRQYNGRDYWTRVITEQLQGSAT